MEFSRTFYWITFLMQYYHMYILFMFVNVYFVTPLKINKYPLPHFPHSPTLPNPGAQFKDSPVILCTLLSSALQGRAQGGAMVLVAPPGPTKNWLYKEHVPQSLKNAKGSIPCGNSSLSAPGALNLNPKSTSIYELGKWAHQRRNYIFSFLIRGVFRNQIGEDGKSGGGGAKKFWKRGEIDELYIPPPPKKNIEKPKTCRFLKGM